MADEVTPELARWFGRFEATLEQHRRDQRREHDDLKKTVLDLANRVAAHDKMIADDRERARKSKEDLSEHQSRAASTETAMQKHLGSIEVQIDKLQRSTEGQDVELSKQTDLLKWIRAATPIITAIASAIGAAAAGYYAHADMVVRTLGVH